MHFTFYTVSIIASGIINITVAAVVMFKRSFDKTCRSWALFSLSLSVWLFGLYFVYTSATYKDALIWDRVLAFGGCIVPITLTIFILDFISHEAPVKRRRQIVWGIAFLSLFNLIIQQTPLVQRQAIQNAPGFFVTGNTTSYISFGILYFITLTMTVILLIKGYRSARAERINQYRYIFAACVVGFGLGFSNAAFPQGSRLPLVSHEGILVANIIVAFAIVRHRLMDIRIVIKKALVYTTTTLGLTFLYLSSIFVIGKMMGNISQGQRYSAVVIAMFVAALVFEPLRNNVQSTVDRIFFKDRFDKQKVIVEFNKSVLSAVDMYELLEKTMRILTRTLKIEKAFFMLLDEHRGVYKIESYVGLDRQNLIWQCSVKNPLISILKSGDILRVTDILGSILEEQARIRLARMGAEVAIPVMTKNKLIGFVCLGRNLSNELTDNDIMAVKTLADQLSIAIENASFDQVTARRGADMLDRRAFMRRLEAEIKRAQEDHVPISIVFVNIDGDEISEAAQVFVADSIKMNIRSFDVAGQIDENQFGLILPGVKPDEIQRLADRLDEALKDIVKPSYRLITRN
jgi:GGDEF domain-containing protein